MKPTHRDRDTGAQVTAWQFLQDAPVPTWIVRTFHDLDGRRRALTKVAMDGTVVTVNLEDWIVTLDSKVCLVLTDAEFRKCFEPV